MHACSQVYKKSSGGKIKKQPKYQQIYMVTEINPTFFYSFKCLTEIEECLSLKNPQVPPLAIMLTSLRP